MAALTLADHVAGFKDVVVTFKAGGVETVRLTAPRRRQARLIAYELFKGQDPWPVVAACLPEALRSEAWLDGLTPASADVVETTAFCLAYGSDFQKKMEALGEAMMTDLMKLALKPSSSELVSESPK